MKHGIECSKRWRVSRKRRGQMLLIFFVFLLAFLPLMALIVDLSLVRLARREMQTAVNAAALEGLRGKGLSQYDRLRRRGNSAQLWIEMSPERREWLENCPYADDRFCFSLGFTTPLQLNLDNAANGDLVAGLYKHRPSDGEQYDHREGHDRDHPDYPFDRRDFTPFPTESEEPESEDIFLDEQGEKSEAFLARRRRTSRDESVLGVSSQEKPVPVFFGHFWPPIEGIRENDVTVRAAAIAVARPAMMVGPAFHNRPELPDIIGAAPFAIKDFIEDLESRGWPDFEESVWYDLQELDPNEDTGQAIHVSRITVTRPLAFGSPVDGDATEMLVISANPPPPNTDLRAYYLPIFRTIPRTDLPDEVCLVVGFGGILVSEVDGEIEQVKRLRFVAPHNASAIARNDLPGELRTFLNEDDFPELSSEQRETIVRELIEEVWRQQPIQDGLLAPALVRALEPTPPRRPEP